MTDKSKPVDKGGCIVFPAEVKVSPYTSKELADRDDNDD